MKRNYCPNFDLHCSKTHNSARIDIFYATNPWSSQACNNIPKNISLPSIALQLLHKIKIKETFKGKCPTLDISVPNGHVCVSRNVELQGVRKLGCELLSDHGSHQPDFHSWERGKVAFSLTFLCILPIFLLWDDGWRSKMIYSWAVHFWRHRRWGRGWGVNSTDINITRQWEG